MKKLTSKIKAFALVGEVSNIGLSKGFKQVAFFMAAPDDIEKARQDVWIRPGAQLIEVELPLIWSVQTEVTMHNAYAVQGHDYFAVELDRENMPEITGVYGAKAVAPSVAGQFVLNMRDMDKLPCPFSMVDFQEVEPVLNLTQHAATEDQVSAGVVEPADKAAIQAAITFDSLPTAEEIKQRAKLVAAIAASTGIKRAMIGGAPFFMSALESALQEVGIQPVYAFSVRDSIEQPDGNGGIKKVNIFRHAGWVEA